MCRSICAVLNDDQWISRSFCFCQAQRQVGLAYELYCTLSRFHLFCFSYFCKLHQLHQLLQQITPCNRCHSAHFGSDHKACIMTPLHLSFVKRKCSSPCASCTACKQLSTPQEEPLDCIDSCNNFRHRHLACVSAPPTSIMIVRQVRPIDSADRGFCSQEAP